MENTDKLLVFINKLNGPRTPDGIILVAIGEDAEADREIAGTNDIGDYDFSERAQHEGLMVWEGYLKADDDAPEYCGKWRKATSKDLIEMKVIES